VLHQIARDVVDNPDFPLEQTLAELLQTGAINALKEVVEVKLSENAIEARDSQGNAFHKLDDTGSVD